MADPIRGNILTRTPGVTRVFWLNVLLMLGMGVFSGNAMALLESEKTAIAVYERVAPSVVNIITRSIRYDFLLQPVPSSGAGSGVIIDRDGTIVTNYHVIHEAETIQVRLADGTRLAAEIVGTAPEDDLAVIRIEGQQRELVPITMGDSEKVRVGQKVYALGNPFGLGHTLTAGTVSQVGRSIKNGERVLKNLIQVDAAINPGNSGGPLVDSRGRLIGINTAIFSPTGASVGIGFAIPVNRVKHVVPGMLSFWNRYLGTLLAVLILFWVWRRISRVE